MFLRESRISRLNLDLKAEKQLQTEKHTEDWALGSSHDSLDLSLCIYVVKFL